MAGLFDMNVQKIQKTKGEIAFSRLFDGGFACTIDPSLSSSTPLLPAQAVVLVNQSGGTADSPFIVTPAGAGDDILGFAINNLRYQGGYASQQIDIAIAGMVMIMEASGALDAGIRVGINSSVQIVDATSGVHGTLNQIGILLDQAVSEGDLVRVMILVPSLTVI
jgi:hypothetical protein